MARTFSTINYRTSTFTYADLLVIKRNAQAALAGPGNRPLITETCPTCVGWGKAYFPDCAGLTKCPRCEGMGRVTTWS